MNNDFDFEDDLAKSIASIVEEETADAQQLYNESVKGTPMPEIAAPSEKRRVPVSNRIDEDSIYDDGDEEPEKKSKKFAIILVLIAVILVAIIGVGAYLIVSKIKGSDDSKKLTYDDYKNSGYEAVAKGDNQAVIDNFEKALAFDEGKKYSSDNLEMLLWIYGSYKKIDESDGTNDNLHNEISALKRMIDMDKFNVDAYRLLIDIYTENEMYDDVLELYNAVKDSGKTDIIACFERANYIMKTLPYADIDPGQYGDDKDIKLLCSIKDSIIYYSIGDSDTFTVYTDNTEITVKEGTTLLKFYAVNKYGFSSEIVTNEYVISYDAPDTPVISPEEQQFNQSEVVKVMIKNFDRTKAKAYYTIDGGEPTEGSAVYEGPFDLPEGKTVVKVLVVDDHGRRSTASKTYVVKYSDTYDKETCQSLIWNKLVSAKKVSYTDGKYVNKEKLVCELSYFNKITVKTVSLQAFGYVIDGEKLDFMYGTDTRTGEVYKVEGKADNYKITKM